MSDQRTPTDPAAPTGPRPPSREEQARRHIAAYYGLELRRRMRLVYDGRPGTITGFRDRYLLARLDDGARVVLHPTWRVTYPHLTTADATGAGAGTSATPAR